MTTRDCLIPIADGIVTDEHKFLCILKDIPDWLAHSICSELKEVSPSLRNGINQINPLYLSDREKI